MIGTVRIIAELFNRGLLIDKIMYKCCFEGLLKDINDDKIICLKILLTLSGKKLMENYINSQKKLRPPFQEQNLLKNYLSKIKDP